MSLPTLLPLFPLPNVVLFPQVLLPLHIFEPRYREMVKDAASGDELLGMILYRPGGEDVANPGNDTYPVGCAGRMIRKIDLPDGRFNILLKGVREFVVREQSFQRPYRLASVEWFPPVPPGLRLPVKLRAELVERVQAYLPDGDERERRILDDPALSDEMLVNLFAFLLDLPFAEKQSLLGVCDLSERASRLVETLEFHLIERDLVPGAEAGRFRMQ